MKRSLLAISTLACLLAAAPTWAATLYDPARFHALGTDFKAARVGDLVTIQVVENATASSVSDTTTRRNNGIGTTISIPHNATWNITAGVNGDFDGGGQTARTGQLVAQLTVSVREVLPNGDLRVGGQQVLLINNEQQRIDLEGRVRPIDISENNVVSSTRLADAHINFVGAGDLTDRQRQAWWRAIVDWMGL